VAVAAGLALAAAALAACSRAERAELGGRSRRYWIEEASQYSVFPFWSSRGDERRREAFHRLRSFGEPAVPVLLELLRSERSAVQGDATGALCELGPAAGRAVPELAGMLHDPDLAGGAAAVLGCIGPEASTAAPGLERVLRAGRGRADRHAAARALAAIGPPGHDALRRAAEDADAETREAALMALASSPDGEEARAAALADPEPRIRARALGTWRPQAPGDAGAHAETLVQAMHDPDALVRETARRTFVGLRQRQQATVPLVVAVLEGGDAESRREAAWWLGGEDRAPLGPEALATLDRALGEGDPTLRVYAARALWLRADRAAVDAGRLAAVLEGAREADSPALRLTAAELLWRMTGRPDPAQRAIEHAVASGDKYVKFQAIDLARALGPEVQAVLPALQTLLQDADREVRRRAERLLSSLHLVP
jgi:HEAT repeat protein